MRLPAVAIFLLVAAPMLSAQTLVRSVNGPAAGSQFGKACIVVPDQNNDGFKDLLVGAPNFNGGRGAIYCISGFYLASGNGASTLWSLAPTVAAGDNFGFALADVGDVTADGVHDFLVGQPGYDHGSGIDNGAVRLVHGISHSLSSLMHGPTASRFGTAMAAAGDVNANGKEDVILGAPDGLGSKGSVYLVDGNKLTLTIGVLSTGVSFFTLGGSDVFDRFGASVAGGVDFSGDGRPEFVIGVPGRDNGAATDAGAVHIRNYVDQTVRTFSSTVAGEALGSSISIGSDYDGDGTVDLVTGAPNFKGGSAYEVGRAVVLSGARVMAQTPPYELRSFAFGSVVPPVNHGDPVPHHHFGAAVKACQDLNNDGVGEILVGASDYFSQGFSGWNFRGLVRLFSGATGEQLAQIVGGTTDRLGNELTGAIDDLNGDGFREFVLAGALSDAGGTDSGVLRCYRLFPVQPVNYCVGQVNSLGCTPSIGSSGAPSANSTIPFHVTASNVVNQKNGLLFYSHAPTAVLFQGGTKCVASPSLRTASQNSGGSPSASDCSGAFSLDFNALITSGIDLSLTAGAEVFAQYWSRDPASPSHTSLSNALRFVVGP
ncbi:MAG: integrin alpha [Planctomycetota bacterium]|nr:integrin alpha [Planctomycetota bacterium]